MDPQRTANPEFVALLRNEGLSESTITSLLNQGFDSTGMLAVMEDGDVRSVAPNLGQVRVLSKVALSCKRPSAVAGSVPPSQPRTRSNSFSHRSVDIYQTPHSMSLGIGVGMESQLLTAPPTPMQTISPSRLGEPIGRRPSSAPSQHLLETTPGYPHGAPRTPSAYSGAMVPVQPRPMSAYSSPSHQPALPMPSHMMSLQHHQMPALPAPPQMQMQQIQAMPQQPQAVPQQLAMTPMPPQQAPRAYSTNYTVPMELMKRDRSLAAMAPMHSPHHSPQTMRKAGPVAVGAASDGALVPLGGSMQAQSVSAANQKLSRRTGPPVIVSSMASPDTSK